MCKFGPHASLGSVAISPAAADWLLPGSERSLGREGRLLAFGSSGFFDWPLANNLARLVPGPVGLAARAQLGPWGIPRGESPGIPWD